MIDPVKSYSVVAWAKLGKDEGHQTVTSQDGHSEAAFQLEYVGGYRGQSSWTNKWGVVVRLTDDPNAQIRATYSASEVKVGQRTQLVGVFEVPNKDGKGKISLYVDGKPAGAPVDVDMSGWNLTKRGKFAFGRTLWHGGPTDYFNGEIDDIWAFDHAVTPAQVEAWYRPTVQARWKLNGPPGSNGTVSGDSGPGNALTLKGGAQIAAGNNRKIPNKQCLVPGGKQVGGAGAQASGPVVDADGSFTVTAMVDAAKPTAPMTALSVAGDKQSTFRVRYNPKVGERPCDPDYDDPATFGPSIAGWEPVTSLEGATTAPAVVRNVSARRICSNDGPDVLSLVYDAPTHTVSLFLNGAEEDPTDFASSTSGLSIFKATGLLQIGRGLVDGKTGDTDPFREYLSGMVDDVWVTKGVLSEDEVSPLSNPIDPETHQDNPELPLAYTDD
ncbi:LamG domain-containing protein [Spirillospora sp. NPDC052269]